MVQDVSPELRASQVADVFGRIHRDQMAGLPLLNQALVVATLGFREYAGRVTGMLVTPWMMSLLLFPAAADSWQNMAMGDKQIHVFPGGARRFMLNVIEGLGPLMMHSVHSPMRDFSDQGAALAEAATFLDRLLTAATGGGEAEGPVDEELLGRILRGEPVAEEVPPAGAVSADASAGPPSAVRSLA